MKSQRIDLSSIFKDESKHTKQSLAQETRKFMNIYFYHQVKWKNNQYWLESELNYKITSARKIKQLSCLNLNLQRPTVYPPNERIDSEKNANQRNQ